MNLYPDDKEFVNAVKNSAQYKNLLVFEHNNNYYILDERTGYVTDAYTITDAANFVNKFQSDIMRAGL